MKMLCGRYTFDEEMDRLAKESDDREMMRIRAEISAVRFDLKSLGILHGFETRAFGRQSVELKNH